MKKMMIGLALVISQNLCAQDSALTQKESTSLTFSGYIEGYYSYDFNRPSTNNRPAFLYNYNRHNEFNANLAFVKGSFSSERIRANVSLGIGTYMNSNYAAEPGTLKNVFEANAGYKLSARKNWWLDIGILPSHIGYETAIGKDNWTLTRSLVAENSPYFESGARLSYTTENGKLQLAVLALSGWQRIMRVEGNSLLSYGAQVAYKPSSRVTLNYSNFIGTDKPDTARLWRYYHNLYGIFQFNDHIGFTAGFDIGMEQKAMNKHNTNTWYTPVAILRITPQEKWAIALRGEYFDDERGVIIGTGTSNGFKTVGGSVNVDYLPQSNVALRLELRTLHSKEAIFIKQEQTTKSNMALTFATSVSF